MLEITFDHRDCKCPSRSTSKGSTAIWGSVSACRWENRPWRSSRWSCRKRCRWTILRRSRSAVSFREARLAVRILRPKFSCLPLCRRSCQVRIVRVPISLTRARVHLYQSTNFRHISVCTSAHIRFICRPDYAVFLYPYDNCEPRTGRVALINRRYQARSINVFTTFTVQYSSLIRAKVRTLHLHSDYPWYSSLLFRFRSENNFNDVHDMWFARFYFILRI